MSESESDSGYFSLGSDSEECLEPTEGTEEVEMSDVLDSSDEDTMDVEGEPASNAELAESSTDAPNISSPTPTSTSTVKPDTKFINYVLILRKEIPTELGTEMSSKSSQSKSEDSSSCPQE